MKFKTCQLRHSDKPILLTIWRDLVRINQIIRCIAGGLPRGKTTSEVAATLISLQVRSKLCLKLGETSDLVNLHDELVHHCQLLLKILDHRLHRLAWNFPIDKTLTTRRTYLDTTLFYLRDEALRQIDLTTDILKAIQAAKSGIHLDTPLLRDADPNLARHLDTERIKEVIKVLADERLKVAQLEYHIVFTGTMKAGKTTAINAIVGANILPTRPEAMTTLPTFIKSNQSLPHPILTIKQASRINVFLEKIHTGEVRISAEKETELKPGVRTAYENIKAGEKIPEKYVEGAVEIAKVLSILNDSLRIAELAEMGNSLMEVFSVAEDLPIVEVAFSPMSGLIDSTSHGRLVLVDSPGPNEAKHSTKLIKIVKDQLARCSAMVIVSNFIVEDARDEEDMKGILDEYITNNPEQNILLINRYDSAKLDGPTPEETRKANSVRYPKISPNRIFLVAAIKAKSASLVQRDLEEFGVVKDDKIESEFAEIGFGDAYDKEAEEYDGVKYKDIKKWRNAVSKVWEKSFFSSIPINSKKGRQAGDGELTPMSCIKEAARQADRLCIEACLRALDTQNRLINTFLAVRGRLNDDELGGLSEDLKSLGRDLDDLALGKETLNKDIQKLTHQLSELIAEQRINLETHAENEIRRIFRLENEKSRAMQDASPLNKRGLFIRFVEGVSRMLPTGQRNKDTSARLNDDNSLPTLQLPNQLAGDYVEDVSFNSKSDAMGFQIKLEESISTFIKEICIQCEEEVKRSVLTLAVTVKELVEIGMHATFQKAATRLDREFTGKLSEEPIDLSMIVNIGAGERAKPSKNTFTKTKIVNESGFWGEIKRDTATFWNAIGGEEKNWGKITVHETMTTFHVEAADLMDIYIKRLNIFQTNLQETVEISVKKKVIDGVDTYFCEVVEYLEAYKNEISDVLSDHKLDVEERIALRQKVQELKERVEQVLEDIAEATDLLSGKKEMAK